MPPTEVTALGFVRTNTTIPVPRVRRGGRAFVCHKRGYILLERIDGIQLGKIRDKLTVWQQFIIAWTIRLCINQLRSASKLYPRRHVPGPMADVPMYADNTHWAYSLGPFETYAALAEDFNNRYRVRERGVAPFDDSELLVLTHSDLAMHNILLDRDGRLWLVDFGFSGFYPPWFESISTVLAARNDEAPASWCRLIPLICGAWEKQRKWAQAQLETGK